MESPTEQMKRELSTLIFPILREKGFAGKLPHFRRITGSKVDLLSFQFDKRGGGFVLNLAVGPADGFTTHWGKFVPADQLDPSYDLGTTIRIQPGEGGAVDNWFRYDRPPSNPVGNIYEATAREVIPFLDNSEKWFGQFCTWTKPDRPTVSSDKVLEQKQLSIVARGQARHASEHEILQELMESGTQPERAHEVYRTIVERLEEKQPQKPWWKFWRC